MIEFLKIASIAIFDEIAIEFGPGLNCITGETGAGKSLIIGALTLLMGAKTGSEVVRPGREKAIVEALFTNGGQEMVLKREIFASGRTRCYINGELATSERLSDLSTDLIHIYGQHQYQDLLNSKEHMRILEDLAGLNRAQIMDCFHAWESARKELGAIEDAIARSRQEQDDIRFRLQELTDAGIAEGEEARITQSLETARAAETLKQSALDAYALLYSEPQSAMDQLSAVRGLLQRMSAHDPRIKNNLEALESAMAQVEDMALTVRELHETYDYDPQEIVRLEERLHLIRDLKRKYHTDESGLEVIKNDLTGKLGVLDDAVGLIDTARAQVQTTHSAYLTSVSNFLNARAGFARTFAERINADLKELGMSGTRFAIHQSDPSCVDQIGMENEDSSPTKLLQGEFMIATNVGQNMLPLAKIASGGELSRIMLAIKVQQRVSQEATLIFDEIDAGISGQTAIMIAGRLKSLAEHAQAIVITHLHQVAALANSHIKVSKDVKDHDTVASIQTVSGQERVLELARMMGGEKPSPKVIAHAKELIKG